MAAHLLRASLVSLVAAAVILSHRAEASHAMAMDIGYEWVSGQTYLITVKFYRDCDGIAAPSTATITLSSVSCGVNQSLTLQKDTSYEVSQLCPTQIGQSACNGGPLPGVELHVYSGLFTFPNQCSDWIISYSHCCRNSAVTNLNSADSYDAFVYATLNNTGGASNNSPVFSTLPTPYLCQGEPFSYNPGAYDPDGDSLAFVLANPLDAFNVNIPYNAPYTPTYPLSTSTGTVTFDPATGQMSFTPNLTQQAVISIKVYEYRNGVLIDSVLRDLQFVVINCSNNQPLFSGVTSVTNAVALDSTTIQICPGSNACFDIVVTDLDTLQTLTVTTNLGAAIPTATYTVSGTNPVTVSICWTPGSGDVGTHYFVIQGEDDACPTTAVGSQGYSIVVASGAYAGPDAYVCGDSTQLQAFGGNSYQWSPAAGLSCTNCSNPRALPDSTTTYVLTAFGSGNSCDSIDSITVFVVPPFTMDAGPNDTICAGGATYLDPTYQSGYTYAFSWSPPATLSNPNIEDPLAFPTATTVYTLSMTANTGCTKTDTVRIVVAGVTPTVRAGVDDDQICSGQATQLSAVFGCGSTCDGAIDPCAGPGSTGDVGTGTSLLSTTSYPAPFGHYYKSARHQLLYRSNELLAAGLPPGGSISEIAFNVGTVASAGTYKNFTVKITCTNLTEFPNGNPVATGFTTVYTPKNYIVALGWNTIAFDTLYEWDGNTNIIVDVCFDNRPDPYTSNDPTYYTPTTYYSVLYIRSDVNDQCDTLATHTRSKSRPNTRFTLCCPASAASGKSFTWVPPGALNNPNIADPVATPPVTTTYTVFVYDSASGCAGFDTVRVNVVSDFTLSTTPDTTICRGSNVQLSTVPSPPASDYTYNWNPNYYLSSTTIPNPIADPMQDVTYIVQVARQGCEHSDTVEVNITDGVAFVSVSPVNVAICEGASVQLNTLTAATPSACGGQANACPSGPYHTVTLGNAYSSSSTYGPFRSYPDFRCQYIIQAADFWSKGIFSGVITQLDLEVVTKASNLPFTNFSVSMGCTPLNEFSIPLTFQTGLTQVYFNTAHTTAVGWNTLVFSTPFAWDGNSNIIIEMCYDQLVAPGNDAVRYTGQSYYSMQYAYSATGTDTGCALSPPTTRYKYRPDFRLTFCANAPGNFTYTWTPPAGLSNPAIANPSASPGGTTIYTLTVSDGVCSNNSQTVRVQVNSMGLTAGPDTNICPVPSTPIQLWSSVATPPLMELNCGVNNDSCGGVMHMHQVGTGMSYSSTYSPFKGKLNTTVGLPEMGRVQYIFTKAELNAAGLVADATINRVQVEAAPNVNGYTFNGMVIKMGCTSMDIFSSTAFVEFLPTVKTVPNGYVVTPGWNVFDLDSSFSWDGQSNVIVEFCYTTGNPNSEAARYTYLGSLKYRTLYSIHIAGGCLNPAIAGTQSAYRPNFAFRACDPIPQPITYSWSPGATLNDSTVSDPTSTATDTTTYTVTVNSGSCSAQDQVTLNICEQLLPITWIDFNAWPAAHYAQLQWTIAPWPTSSHFVIERREPGGAFKQIGTVGATGATTYSFRDMQPYFPVNYYRIRHVDQSGGYDYSVVRTVEFFNHFLTATLYPNPLDDGELNVSIEGLVRPEVVDVKIFNPLGALLAKRQLLVTPQHNVMQFENRLFYAGGTYVIRIEATGQVMHLNLARP